MQPVQPSAADPRVVELWPGPVPGDVGIDAEEKHYVHDSKYVGSTLLITNVSRPALTVYLPPAEKNTGTALIICPGGGYWDLFWELEGEEVAAWFKARGIVAIILKYRVPRRPGEAKGVPAAGPLLDAQRAVSMVRDRAVEWGVDPDRIGIAGFSAGGHLALEAATRFERRAYDAVDAVDALSCRPDFAVLCYSGFLKRLDDDRLREEISIPAATPPVFLAHASDDSEPGAAVEHSVLMYLALHRAGVTAELHVYASGEHDFGVREGALPSSWPQLCLNWLRSKKLL